VNLREGGDHGDNTEQAPGRTSAEARAGRASDDSKVRAHQDDSKLISDGLQGDRNAFEILFSRYRPILYRLAQRVLRNHEESEDAVQNCSLVAFRKMESFKYEGAFRSWLARILVNEAIMILRKRKRTNSSEYLNPTRTRGSSRLAPTPRTKSGANSFSEAKRQCLNAQTLPIEFGAAIPTSLCLRWCWSQKGSRSLETSLSNHRRTNPGQLPRPPFATKDSQNRNPFGT